MEPDFIQSILALLNAGKWLEAEGLCHRYLERDPDDEGGLLMLAMCLQGQGRLHEARDCYRRLTKLKPAVAAHWCNYGSILRELGELIDAEQAYAQAVKASPGDVTPKIPLGLLLIARHEYLQARDVLLDAFELDKNQPVSRIYAARACCLCQDFQGAIDLLRPWRSWMPLQDFMLQKELARLLTLITDAPGAHYVLIDLVARNPSDLESLLLLAISYERLNRIDDAAATARVARGLLSNDPDPQAIAELAHIEALLMSRNGQVDAARQLLLRSGPRHAEDDAHYFELAKVCDKSGDAAGAIEALNQAHAIQVVELKRSSPEFFGPDAPAMPAAVPRVTAEVYARWPLLVAPESGDSPVFIVGFPRSGTTLLEQMLDAHPKLQSMDENPFFNRLADKLRRHDPLLLSNIDRLRQYDCDELRKQYQLMVSLTIKRQWDARLVDKNPLHLLWLPLIYRLYPNAKFILAIRHPCDVILSCYMQNFRSSILGAACANLDRLARAYVQAMAYWFEDAALFKPDVLILRHEDLVADVSAQAMRIAEFLQLDDVAPMLEFDRRAKDKGYIATPSYSQVIEPINRRGIGRWHKYRQEFEPLLPLLESMLRHWGYA